MSYDLKGFFTELAAREEFRNVAAQPVDGGNLVGISGYVIGKSRVHEIHKLGRQHGLFIFADRLSTWNSQEDFKRYGSGRAQMSEKDSSEY